MKQPIADHKQICRGLAPEGWHYGGYDAERYLFQTGSYATGFRLMECLEEDLTKENLEFMAKHGLTRSPGPARRANRDAPSTNADRTDRPRLRG